MNDEAGGPKSELTPQLQAVEASSFHESLELALEQVEIGLMMFEDGRPTYANSTLEVLLGYPASELVQMDPFAIAVEEERDRLRARLRARQAGGEVEDHYVVRARHRDGRVVDIELSIARLPAENLKVLVLLRDVTERRLQERRSRQSQKMEAVGQLAAEIAHDFDNYLGAVELITESLRRCEGEEERSTLLTELEEVTTGARRVTRQLSTFSGRHLSRPTVLDMNIVVFEMFSMLQRLMGDSVELAPQLEPGLPPVSVDPGQLHQIIVNLINNAREATADGGRVTIETHLEDDGKSVSLVVRDAGEGMEPHVLERACEPFFTTRPEEASGMGLSIVYGIVKQCGGSIEFDSTPGEGTRVRVNLPTTGEAGERP